MTRPNIIFFQTDSQDGRVMGCAGHPAAHTPHMDALAARGTLFENAYCNAPQCVPSRASMWSGQHTHHCEGWNNYKGIDADVPTFVDHLQHAGYRTECIGRTDHLSGNHSMRARLMAWTRAANLPELFHVNSPRPVLMTDCAERVREQDWPRIDATVDWLGQQADAQQPFFLHLGLIHPHPGGGFKTSPHYLERIDAERIPEPPVDDPPHPCMDYMIRMKSCDRALSDSLVRSVRHHYVASISEIDTMLGTVLEAVDRLGLRENTYVIFTSDHGEMNMEHGQHLKNALYEPSARIPMIVAGPGVRQGERITTAVSLVDMFPTFMDMAGAPQPAGLDGRSLMPLLTDGRDDGREDEAFAEYHSNFQPTGSFMLRRGPWKYIAYAGYEPQLFQLEDDPEERRNLAAERGDVAAEMDERLRGYVDYEALNRRVIDEDRAAFNRWRGEVGEDEYQQTMRELTWRWDSDMQHALDRWAAGA